MIRSGRVGGGMGAERDSTSICNIIFCCLFLCLFVDWLVSLLFGWVVLVVSAANGGSSNSK